AMDIAIALMKFSCAWPMAARYWSPASAAILAYVVIGEFLSLCGWRGHAQYATHLLRTSKIDVFVDGRSRKRGSPANCRAFFLCGTFRDALPSARFPAGEVVGHTPKGLSDALIHARHARGLADCRGCSDGLGANDHGRRTGRLRAPSLQHDRHGRAEAVLCRDAGRQARDDRHEQPRGHRVS